MRSAIEFRFRFIAIQIHLPPDTVIALQIILYSYYDCS